MKIFIYVIHNLGGGCVSLYISTPTSHFNSFPFCIRTTHTSKHLKGEAFHGAYWMLSLAYAYICVMFKVFARISCTWAIMKIIAFTHFLCDPYPDMGSHDMDLFPVCVHWDDYLFTCICSKPKNDNVMFHLFWFLINGCIPQIYQSVASF